MSTLADLIAAVDSALYEGTLPHDLVTAWERVGAAAWQACDEPGPLLRVLVYADARGAATAAAGCARAALLRTEHGNSAALRAIEAAEAWGRGNGGASACYEAAWAATRASHEHSSHVAAAFLSAAHAAFVPHASEKGARAGAADHASLAASCAAANEPYGEPRDEHALPELARLVRTFASCPSVAQPSRG